MNENTTPIGTTTGAGGGTSPGSTEAEFGGSATARVAQQGKEAGQSFQAQGQQLKDTAREKGAETARQVKQGARNAARDAMGYGRTIVQDQKSNLAARVQEYADAARAASEKLKGDQDLLAGPAERAASQLDRASQYLRDKEPGDLLDDLESFARRRPEIVYGGMFVAGLAAARFLKASQRSSREISRGSYAESPTSTYAPTGGLTTTGSTSPSWQSTPATAPESGVGATAGSSSLGAGSSTGIPAGGSGSGLGGVSTGASTGYPPGSAGTAAGNSGGPASAEAASSDTPKGDITATGSSDRITL